MIPEDIRKCFDNICENYGIQAGLNMSESLRDREQPTMQVIFINMRISSYFCVEDIEVLKTLTQKRIKSKKDYRKLRSLIRMRILNALRLIQDLAEDGIRNLGAKP